MAARRRARRSPRRGPSTRCASTAASRENAAQERQTSCWNEYEEIGNYTAIETLAESLNDAETAQARARLPRQEERRRRRPAQADPGAGRSSRRSSAEERRAAARAARRGRGRRGRARSSRGRSVAVGVLLATSRRRARRARARRSRSGSSRRTRRGSGSSSRSVGHHAGSRSTRASSSYTRLAPDRLPLCGSSTVEQAVWVINPIRRRSGGLACASSARASRRRSRSSTCDVVYLVQLEGGHVLAGARRCSPCSRRAAARHRGCPSRHARGPRRRGRRERLGPRRPPGEGLEESHYHVGLPLRRRAPAAAVDVRRPDEDLALLRWPGWRHRIGLPGLDVMRSSREVRASRARRCALVALAGDRSTSASGRPAEFQLLLVPVARGDCARVRT